MRDENQNIDFYYLERENHTVAGLAVSTGWIAESYDYYAYGSVKVYDVYRDEVDPVEGSQWGNPYFFTGRRLDVVADRGLNQGFRPTNLPLAWPRQLYHYRARTMDPIHGRFMQRDPLVYVDGMNLYEYVASNPLVKVDPEGSASFGPSDSWTLLSAVKEVRKEIRKWRGLGYNFAADLFTHFINKKGPIDYVPTAANIAEVKKYGPDAIADVIWKHLVAKYPKAVYSTGSYPIIITHPGKGSNVGSNIRWWVTLSNKNLFNAYGGADLNVTGEVIISENQLARQLHALPRDIGGGYELPSVTANRLRLTYNWTGTFNIRLGDEYVFDSPNSKKTWISASSSDAYNAALWLERNCGFKPFYHEMSFSLKIRK